MAEESSRFPETHSPEIPAASARLPSGQSIALRLLRPDDAARLSRYFHGLSAETRSLYGPHPFDQATADAICATLAPAEMLRMTATLPEAGDARIIAYFLLMMGVHESDGQRYAALGIPLNPASDATLAPSVADDFQSQGVGSLVMAHLLPAARSLGRRRIVLWGGVQARNARGLRFYTKWGFRKVGEFTTSVLNYDMILDL